MYEYRVSFEGLPQTCWACYAENKNFCWDSSVLSDDMLEIGIMSSEKHSITVSGKEHFFNSAPVLYCIAGNDGSFASAEPEVLVKDTTVSVRFPKLIINKEPLSNSDYADSSMLILPRFLDNCSDEFIADIMHLLNSYISTNTVNSAESRMGCLSIFFRILATIDGHMRNRYFKKNEKSYYYYVKKINAIINERYATKISQQKIAEELGISASYLSSMYKQATGLSFSKYLLQTRMNHAMELLASTNMTTAELAAAVGFEAESHFRRRFKEYTGINVREYRYIQKEMTLYHQKPTRHEQ